MNRILTLSLAAIFLFAAGWLPAFADGGTRNDCYYDNCRPVQKPVKQPCRNYCEDSCYNYGCGSRERVSYQYDYSYRYEREGNACSAVVYYNGRSERRNVPCEDDRYYDRYGDYNADYYDYDPYYGSNRSISRRTFPSLPVRPSPRPVYDDYYYGDYYDQSSSRRTFPSLPVRPSPRSYSYDY